MPLVLTRGQVSPLSTFSLLVQSLRSNTDNTVKNTYLLYDMDMRGVATPSGVFRQPPTSRLVETRVSRPFPYPLIPLSCQVRLRLDDGYPLLSYSVLPHPLNKNDPLGLSLDGDNLDHISGPECRSARLPPIANT